MTDQIPDVQIQPARKSLLERVSIVWLIPIGALLLAFGMVWQNYQERGSVVQISFESATGIVPNQTELRFRDVPVGMVERISFAKDLSSVVAHVRVDQDVEDYIDVDAVFWVVRPEVSARGISGLSTVLNGVYIEGSWNADAGGLHTQFRGLDNPPIARPGQLGTSITLKSETANGISAGTPIFYKGLEVGRVGKPALAKDGPGIEADAYIFAPHDELLSTRTRFWETSGFSFNLDASGASIDFESVASLISGGIAFETMVSGGVPIENGEDYTLYGDQNIARSSIFDDQDVDRPKVEVAVVFEENVTGLSVGAPVSWRGLDVGKVVDLSGRVDAEQFGDEKVRLVVVLSLALDDIKTKAQASVTEEDVLDFLEIQVAEGLRARLTQASVFSGSLKIDLLVPEDAGPASFDRNAAPYPIIPSIPAKINDVAASAEGLMQRVNGLPVEELLGSAISFLNSASALVANDDLQQTPADIRLLVQNLQTVVNNKDLQELPKQLAVATENLNAILQKIDTEQGVERLFSAVDAAGKAAADVGSAVEDIPAVVARIEAVAAKVETLEVEPLLDEVALLVSAAQALLATEATKDLPAYLNTTLDQLALAIKDMRDGGTIEKVNETLGSAQGAARAVETAVNDLPDVMRRIEAVLTQSEKAIASLSESGALNKEARTTLRDISSAADAFRSLARALERKPNALFIGK